MYQLWTFINSDLKEGLKGCPVLSFCLFSQPCSQISPHLNLSLQQVLNHHVHQTCITNIKVSFLYVPTMNYYHLWPERRVRRVSCPQFWPFFPTMCGQISPHLNWSLQQVVNQHLHRNNMTNIKLTFPCVPAVNYYQLWPKRRVRMVSCPQFLSIFTTMFQDFPTSELKSPASCQPTSAPNMHNQYQIFLSICTHYELLSSLTWKKG